MADSIPDSQSMPNAVIETSETMSPSNGDTTPTLRTAPSPLRPNVIRPLILGKSYNEFWMSNEPHRVALVAFLTGTVLSGSVAVAICFPSTAQCWLYVSFLCIFHFLEYFITAKYKPSEVTLDCIFLLDDVDLAFLFNNGWSYLAAQVLGLVEFLIEWYFLPHAKMLSLTTFTGINPVVSY
jgi:hypothetical protein